MKVVYDCVYGPGLFASGITDTLPNMLQVSRVRPGQDEGGLIWRKLKGERFAPYWQGKDPRQMRHSLRWWCGNTIFFVGSPMSIEEAVVLIKHFKKTLHRKDGTLVVQLRTSDGEMREFTEESPTFLISIAHTTKRSWETTNPSHPDGFPTRLR